MLTRPRNGLSKLLAAKSPEFFEEELKEEFGENWAKVITGINSHFKT
jgi:hypothetical protein